MKGRNEMNQFLKNTGRSVKNWFVFLGLTSVLSLLGSASIVCAQTVTQPKEATSFTKTLNAEFLKPPLNYAETSDFDRVSKGLVATTNSLVLRSMAGNGRIVWNMDRFAFITGDTAPDSVNPSLWRQARLNNRHGLYEVIAADFGGEQRCIWQVRGYDLANITFVEGEEGFIVIDPLTSQETAKAAVEFFYTNIPEAKRSKPITNVIYTHSHADHYGGVRAVLNSGKMASQYEIWAPEGFLESAASENVLAGSAMAAHARYMYGILLPAGERSYVDVGLGKANSIGTNSLVAPTKIISEDNATTMDGLTVEFMMANGTEAPAEMCFYFPAYKALCVAEVANACMHNLLTPRGAPVRDPIKWSEALDQMYRKWGNEADVTFGPHHWPRWGNADIQNYLTKQRDAYRYLNDQTLHLANKLYSPVEIAEMISLPDSLQGEWFIHGYYGTVVHNVKAVYQRYLGWFDGNPVHLNPLPPKQAAACYMTYIPAAGGDLLAAAQMAYADGKYRWVVEILEHVVNAQPNNTVARELQADAYEQMGYQAESGVWRNFFLTAALSNRDVNARNFLAIPAMGTMTPDVLAALTVDQLMNYYATLIDGPAAGKSPRTVINWTINNPDASHEDWYMVLENGVINHWTGIAPIADCSITLTRQQFQDAVQKAGQMAKLLTAPGVVITGSNTDALTLLDALTLQPETKSANAFFMH